MPPSAATNRAATRASRRQHGSINSAVSTDHQPPSCLSKALPISLCCSSCKARSDPILYGNRNKENICRQLWIEGNCVTLEDGHARALITDHLNIQGSAALITAAATAPASTTIQPRAPLFSISVMARARAAAGYNPRRHSLPSVSPPPPLLLLPGTQAIWVNVLPLLDYVLALLPEILGVFSATWHLPSGALHHSSFQCHAKRILG